MSTSILMKCVVTVFFFSPHQGHRCRDDQHNNRLTAGSGQRDRRDDVNSQLSRQAASRDVYTASRQQWETFDDDMSRYASNGDFATNGRWQSTPNIGAFNSAERHASPSFQATNMVTPGYAYTGCIDQQRGYTPSAPMQVGPCANGGTAAIYGNYVHAHQ